MDRQLWVLNLDVEDELARGTQPYTRPRAVEARMRALAGRLRALTGEAEVLVGAADRAAQGAAATGRAWCPTPSALRLLAAAGAQLPRAPTEAVLRRVLHRRFAIEAELGWAESRWIERAAAIPDRGRWRLKRGFGYAGRGQRVVDGAALDPADHAWVAASLAEGGLLIEPELAAITATPALHGYLDPAGTVVLGEPTLQQIDARGAWQDTVRAPVEASLHAAMVTAAERAAAALHAAGYFGAFGVDALVSATATVPLGELNARYTMGWVVGMGAWRPPAGLP